MTPRTFWFLLLAAGCQAPQPSRPIGEPLARRGEEIVICGQLFHAGTPVVLWTDPGGYDAYRLERRFRDEDGETQRVPRRRYHSFRGGLSDELAARVRRDGWSLADLREVVDQFVLHFDAAGCARRCFEILHDHRNLSVHFLLDVDGTIYQTLDVKERAWHATKANDRSVGIEIAHPGAAPTAKKDAFFATWYTVDRDGVLLQFPPSVGEPRIRTPGFVARPSRAVPIVGEIHGHELHQYDFTDAQYRALARLTKALSKALPRITLRAPRSTDGAVLARQLDDAEFAEHHGVLGHFHVQANKTDPGPAFDWDRLLRAAAASR